MRLKLAHRLILYIGSLLMVFFGVAVFFFSLRFNQLMIREEGVPFFSLARLGLLTGAALTIAFGVFCVTLPHRMKQGRAEFVTQKTQSGELKISVQAIESIVHKSLSEHEEIKLRQLKVTNTRAGIEVDVKAALAGNINIPLAVNAIQKYIRHSLSTTLSIDAREVRVIVVSADIQAKDSPYLIPKTVLEIPQKEAKAEPTQPDHHQKGREHMEKLNDRVKNAFKPGTPSAKLSFGLLFFFLALLIVVFGFWKALFVLAVTLMGVFIGSAETLGKATAKLIDKIYPEKNRKVVYTQEDLEKVRKAAEANREAQQKAEEAKEQE